MISVKLSASPGATRCHITCVSENPCSSNSGGPLPLTRAKIRPELVLIHSEENPGNKSARSGIERVLLFSPHSPDFRNPAIGPAAYVRLRRIQAMTLPPPSTTNQNEETRHVDRFRSPGRGQGDPAKGS